jgi:anaerobic selenocysteine-containing dehydrogenase
LLSPANNKTINSMFGERHAEAPLVHLNTTDAAARGIVDGQQVLLFNELASLELTAHVGDDVRPGVVVVAKGFWSRSFGRTDGLALNALIARRVEPLAGGACFFDVPVQVRATRRSSPRNLRKRSAGFP